MRVPVQLPFWERTKKLIRAHKISQKNFADYVGINYNTLKFWMCYGFLPIADLACNIADALGVSVEYLVKGADEEAMKVREEEALTRKTAASEIKKMASLIKKNAGLIG